MTSRFARRRPTELVDRLLLLPALLLALGPAPLAWAGGLYYVDDDAGPGGDGSFGSPWMTITEAMQSGVLMDGDTVLVAPGDYDGDRGESFPVQLVSGITVQGPGDGTAICRSEGSTIIQMQNLATGTTTVDGMRFELFSTSPSAEGVGE